MLRTFESLQCDGKNFFEWDRYEAAAPDQHQDHIILTKYDKPFGLDVPFEIMVTSAMDQEQMVVTAMERLPDGRMRLSVSRGENEPAKDLRYTGAAGNATYFNCSEQNFPRFAPDEWGCDPSKYWNKDGW